MNALKKAIAIIFALLGIIFLFPSASSSSQVVFFTYLWKIPISAFSFLAYWLIAASKKGRKKMFQNKVKYFIAIILILLNKY